MDENTNNKLDINKNNNDKIKTSTSGEHLNVKNIIKFLLILIFSLIVLILGFKSCFKQDNKIKKVKENQEENLESVINEKKSTYSDEKAEVDKSIERVVNGEELPERIETIVATDDDETQYQRELTPIEQYMQQVELEKIQRYQEARRSPFKSIESRKVKDKEKNGENRDLIYSDEEQEYLSNLRNNLPNFSNLNGENSYNNAKEKQRWLMNASKDNFILQKPLNYPINRYEVKTGSIIPITIMTDINSDLPGTILALVRENVYDTITGIERVIPAGSKLIGTYSNEVSFGQVRLQAVFNRLILPNGKTISLDGMNLSDMKGQSGLTGKVDLHLGKVIGSVAMTAAVGGINALVSDKKTEKEKESVSETALKTATASALGVASDYSKKVLNVAPTISIKAGSRASIIVEKDIVLEKYNKELKYIVE